MHQKIGRNHNSTAVTFSWKKLGFFASLFLIIPAAVAYASFFSFFGDIFAKVTTETRPLNSQNIALLAAPLGARGGSPFDSTEVNTVGDSALLPDVGPTGGPSNIDGETGIGQISIYVVHEGDSLSEIAGMFGVSVNTVLWANNMKKGAPISVGQSLLILPVSGVRYEVKNGDTISGIAKKFHGDPDEIRSYNGISEGDNLDPGSVVIVPDGEIPAIVPVVTKPANSKVRGVSTTNDDAYFVSPLASYRVSQKLHGYNGADLAAPLGSTLRAAASGKVIVARQGGYNGGYGNYVVIQHSNGTQTLYGHMLSVSVVEGQSVTQGQTIGFLGSTGRSTGPHVHFEVRGARNPFGY